MITSIDILEVEPTLAKVCEVGLLLLFLLLALPLLILALIFKPIRSMLPELMAVLIHAWTPQPLLIFCLAFKHFLTYVRIHMLTDLNCNMLDFVVNFT